MSADDTQLLGTGAQILVPVVGYDYEILDSNAESFGNVDPRLDRDDVAGNQLVLGALREARRFVDLHSHSVADPMTKESAMSRRRDHITPGAIHIASRDTRTHGREPGQLGRNHGFIDLSRLGRRSPPGSHRPSAISAVAIDDYAEVDGHELAGLDRSIARLRVRVGGVGARRDDRRKRDRLSTELAHPDLGANRDLALGAPGESCLLDRRKYLIGQPRRLRNRVALVWVLRAPQTGNQGRRRHQLDLVTGQLLEPTVRLNARVRIVETHSAGQVVLESRQQLALSRDAVKWAADLSRSPLRVAEVRDEETRLWSHHRQSARTGEAREPDQPGGGLACRVTRPNEVPDQ